MIAERDDYKMPPLFTGEYTPEILEEKRKHNLEAERKLEELKKVFEERKKAVAQ